MVIKLSAVLVALAAMMGNVESIGLTKGDGKMGKANTTIPTMLLEGQRSTMRREGKIATNYAIEAGSANYGLGLCDPAHESIMIIALAHYTAHANTWQNFKYDGANQLPYLRGVFWNDDPDMLLFEGNDETTEEGEHSTGTTWYATYLGCPVHGYNSQSMLCQSHFYWNQFLHGMARKPCMCPDEAVWEIMNWCEFAYRGAVGMNVHDGYNGCTKLRNSNLAVAPHLQEQRNEVIEYYMWTTLGALFGSPTDGIDHCSDACDGFSMFTNGYGCEWTGRAGRCKEAESGTGTVETETNVCEDVWVSYKGCGCAEKYTSDEDANCLECIGDTVKWSQNVHKRALGSLAHTIMDSYSAAHTVRIDEVMTSDGHGCHSSSCNYPEGGCADVGEAFGCNYATGVGKTGTIRSYFGAVSPTAAIGPSKEDSEWHHMSEGHKNVGKIVSVSTYQGQSDSRHKYYDSLTEGYTKDYLADGYTVELDDITHSPGAWEAEKATSMILHTVWSDDAWSKTNGDSIVDNGGEIELRAAVFRVNDASGCTDKASTYGPGMLNSHWGGDDVTQACQLPSGPGMLRDSISWPGGAQTSLPEIQCRFQGAPCTCPGPNGAGFAVNDIGTSGCSLVSACTGGVDAGCAEEAP